jgi:hypothetical protein
MQVSTAVAVMAVTASVAAEVAVLWQAGVPTTGDALQHLGPYLVPLLGVVVSYASLRTAFSEHRANYATHKALVEVELEARARKDVVEQRLDSFDAQIRHVTTQLEKLHQDVGGIAVGVAELRGRFPKP